MECYETSFCSTIISAYVLGWLLTTLVHGSVRSEWSNILNLSIEKIAKMRMIGWRRTAQGLLILVAVLCGTFLFSIISADSIPKSTYVVGATGSVAICGIFLSEVYTSLNAQHRLTEQSESGQLDDGEIENEEPVEECSWYFVSIR